MLVDYHVHSDFSEDSNTTMRNHINRAIELGLEEICFTEHLEYGFSQGDWKIDIAEFCEMIDGFDDQTIKVRKGCEAGIACDEDHFRRLKIDVTGNFDFVLFSLHGLFGMDPYREDIFTGRGAATVCRDYARTLYDKTRYFYENGFDFSCVAHLDYLSKAFSRDQLPDGQFKYELAADEIDELFKYLIEKGKCIELNTSTWRVSDLNPPFDIQWLKRYAELGGEYITIGSDAHSPEHIGYGIREAMEFAKKCNIKYYATFENRKPVLHRL